MKSSEPLFTRQNPFPKECRGGKAHYHPSRKHSLSETEKKTALSPVHLNQRSSPHITTLTTENHPLLEKAQGCFGITDGQPVFSESWPSTDCGSSPTSTVASSDMDTPVHTVRAAKSAISVEPGVEQDSVLAKYIERFRHGAPQSREERQQLDSATGDKWPFWWTSSSSLPSSSTPTKTTDRDVIRPQKDDHRAAFFSLAGKSRHDTSLSPCRESLSILSEGEFDDTEIQHLQERADRLVLRDECALSDGSICVSSDGLGCFSPPVSADELLRRPLIPGGIKTTAAKAMSDSVQAVSSQKPIFTPSLASVQRPEEDILFQWRLRRKIEQAGECAQPLKHSSLHGSTFTWQAPSFSHPPGRGQAYKQHLITQPHEFSQKATHPHVAVPGGTEAHPSYPPASGPPAVPAFVVSGSPVSHPHAFPHVPAHMHLLCDVLPCPIQSSHAGRQQNISHNIDESRSKVSKEMAQVSGNSSTFPDEPIRERVLSPLPASSETVVREERGHHKRCERNSNKKAKTRDSERTTVVATRQQRKSRSTSHLRVPKHITPQAEQRHERGRKESSSERCLHHSTPPPPSPIHSALGQVVSEVLFPAMDLSPATRTPVLSDSPPCTASVPLHSSVPPCDAQNSVEVISQLLQEAEDSDEKEFEEDPLLQVLRKQRARIKEQISQVDSMLTELLDEEQVP